MPYAQPGLKAVLKDALQWDSFRDFLRLGIPGGFMMQLEGNSYDITTLLAGLLGTRKSQPQSSDDSLHCFLSSLKPRCIPHSCSRELKALSSAESLGAVQVQRRWMRTMYY